MGISPVASFPVSLPARPRIDRDLIAPIRRMSLENPLWGAPRIHGALLKLGFICAQSTVSKSMAPRRGRPTLGWSAFLKSQAGATAAVDLFAVRTVTLERLYAFVVLGHGRRPILHIEVTSGPTALWLAHQLTEAFPWDSAPRFLVRDNDGLFGAAFHRRITAMGIRDSPVRPRSPWMNGHVERLFGAASRRECKDHQLTWSQAHLRRVLRAYADYYNNDRPHLALDKDSPHSRPIEREGRLASKRILGGLHHRYYRKPPK